MKLIFSVSSLLLLAGCSTKQDYMPTGDPIGVPYIVDLKVGSSSVDTTTVSLNAEVQFGGFGYGPAKVDFLDGTKLLYTTSKETPVGENIQKFNYSGNFMAATGVSYSLKAVVTWNYAGGGKIESSVIIYP